MNKQGKKRHSKQAATLRFFFFGVLPTDQHLREHTSETTKRINLVPGRTSTPKGPLQLAGAQFLPGTWLEMNRLLRRGAGQTWGRDRAGAAR